MPRNVYKIPWFNSAMSDTGSIISVNTRSEVWKWTELLERGLLNESINQTDLKSESVDDNATPSNL